MRRIVILSLVFSLSGPSLFALCRGRDVATRVADAMNAAVRAHTGGDPETYVSAIAPRGAHVI